MHRGAQLQLQEAAGAVLGTSWFSNTRPTPSKSLARCVGVATSIKQMCRNDTQRDWHAARATGRNHCGGGSGAAGRRSTGLPPNRAAPQRVDGADAQRTRRSPTPGLGWLRHGPAGPGRTPPHGHAGGCRAPIMAALGGGCQACRGGPCPAGPRPSPSPLPLHGRAIAALRWCAGWRQSGSAATLDARSAGSAAGPARRCARRWALQLAAMRLGQYMG
jgi:hypothetical protein